MNDNKNRPGSWMMKLHMETNRLRIEKRSEPMSAMSFAHSVVSHFDGKKDPLIEKALSNIEQFPKRQPSS